MLAFACVLRGIIGDNPWKAAEGYTFSNDYDLLQTGDWVVPHFPVSRLWKNRLGALRNVACFDLARHCRFGCGPYIFVFFARKSCLVTDCTKIPARHELTSLGRSGKGQHTRR